MSSDEQEQPNEEPSNEELRNMIRKLVPKVDLQKTGIKSFTKLLSKKLGGVNLKPRSRFIKDALSEAINELDDDNDEESEAQDNGGGDDDDDDDSEEESAAVATSKRAKTKRAAKGTKSGGSGNGLTVKKEISSKLAKFLKQGTRMARTEVVKGLWDYIKANDLQNPENKREIILDDAMYEVFGCERFTMFTMNKYVGAHIHPFKEVDLTPRKTTSPKKRKRKAGKESSANDKKKRKAKKPGLQPPYKLSSDLIAVVGKDVLPRPQVVTALWNYIKSKDLQNPNDKREIICDDKLKAVMGGHDKVTMFNMNRYITAHLLEKLDRSAYIHEEEEEDDEAQEEEEEEEDSDSEDDE